MSLPPWLNQEDDGTSSSAGIYIKKDESDEIKKLTEEWLAKGNQIEVIETRKHELISEAQICEQYQIPATWLRKKITSKSFVRSLNSRELRTRSTDKIELLFDAYEVAQYMQKFKPFSIKSKSQPQ